MTNQANIAALASAMFDGMEVATRADESTFTRVKQDAPGWILDTVSAVHDDSEILPDDRLYSLSRAAAGFMASHPAEDWDDGAHQFADEQCGIYHAELLAWLSSGAYRVQTLDEAIGDMGWPEGGLYNAIQMAQAEEARSVFEMVRQTLAAKAEEEAEEDSSD